LKVKVENVIGRSAVYLLKVLEPQDEFMNVLMY